MEELTDAEFLAKFGRNRPTKCMSVAQKAMKRGGRKYFDSGDHFMCGQTGEDSPEAPKPMPTPESIPHPSERRASNLASPLDGSASSSTSSHPLASSS